MKMSKNLVIFIIFLILVGIFTYPLIFKLTTDIPGFFSTNEPYITLWSSWWIKYTFQHHLSFTSTDLIAYPFGVKPYSSGYKSYLWMALFYFLSLCSTPEVTYNFQILFNLLFSGWFTYLLVFHLTKSRLSSIFCGLVFAFCPYQFMRVWQHLGLTYNQWIPLILLTAILLKETISVKREVIFLLSLLLLFSFDFSIMYLGAIVLLSFIFYHLIYHWRLKIVKKELLKKDLDYLKRILIICIVGGLILSFQFIPTLKKMVSSSSAVPSAYNSYHRQFEDLFSQSARPLSYFLPASVHPIFGGFTEMFIGSFFYGESFTEHTLYLGWIPLILAFVAFNRWKRIRQKKTFNKSAIGDDFFIGFFVFLAVVAWFFSQPPWWGVGKLRIYMPSFFMYKILPMYRAYCRFGIVVMLAVAVLAGFGLKFILERFKKKSSRIVITMVFCALVSFEFWNYPPLKVIDLTKYPKVYDWLRQEPDNIVIAEYPLDAGGESEFYKFYQTKHHKKMINGTVPGTIANRISCSLLDIGDYKTAGGLRWLGVKYVLVHLNSYRANENVQARKTLENVGKNKGLQLVKATADIDVYEVIAKPVSPKVE